MWHLLILCLQTAITGLWFITAWFLVIRPLFHGLKLDWHWPNSGWRWFFTAFGLCVLATLFNFLTLDGIWNGFGIVAALLLYVFNAAELRAAYTKYRAAVGY